MGSGNELRDLLRHKIEVDDDLIAVACQYAENPKLMVSDLRKLIGEDFNRVFWKQRRDVKWWRFWEWFDTIQQEWQILDGPSKYSPFAQTVEQMKYRLRLERLILATTLASGRAPENFRDFDLKLLQEFHDACAAIQHGGRTWFGEPDTRLVEQSVLALEMRIRFGDAIAEVGSGPEEMTVERSVEDMPGAETPAGNQTPSVSVNAQMLDIMQSVGNEVCLEWSVEDWRNKLFERFGRKPSKSTIHKQPTWDLIRTLRIQAGVEAHEHQTAKDETGRRRSRIT